MKKCEGYFGYEPGGLIASEVGIMRYFCLWKGISGEIIAKIWIEERTEFEGNDDNSICSLEPKMYEEGLTMCFRLTSN